MDTVKLNQPMPGANQCPQCGTPLPTGALAGLCPACLLKLGAAADTVTEAKQPAFNPPSVSELAPLFPQLEILELIGKGGMGAVYKARQKQLDRIVALKILPPGIGHDAAFADRFTREAKALAKLNHPGIVTLYEFGQTAAPLPPAAGAQPQLYFFLMEFVDGVNLRQLLHAGRISAREALAIVPQICDALQFAHDQGIVHRDIKPENILLDRRGRVKVADFGLAKIISNDAPLNPSLSPSDGERVAKPGEGSPVLTDAGKVMGTPQYMSPEQIQAPGEVDHRADIYALGVVFYQMLTGELPGKKIEPPSKKVSIDVRLDEIVLRALEKKPERRYQQVSEVKTMVETIAATPGEGKKTGSDETKSTASSPPIVYAKRKTKGEFLGIGCAVQAIGLGCFFIPFVGPVLGIVLLIIGGRMALKLVCSKCGKRTDKEATVCTSCGAHFKQCFSRTAIGGAVVLATSAVFLLDFFVRHAKYSTLDSFYGGLMFCGVVGMVLIGTIAGWIAVAQIRRSAGKLHGLGLAVFDGLLFPLLALDALLVAGQLAAYGALNGNPLNVNINPFLFFLMLQVALVVDWLIIRRVWRAVNAATKVDALPAIESWLVLMDKGDYAATWRTASPMFRYVVSESEWVGRCVKIRKPLGNVIARELKTSRNVGLGKLFKAQFATRFDGGFDALETVTFSRQADGSWKAFTYIVRNGTDLARDWKKVFWIMLAALLLLAVVSVLGPIINQGMSSRTAGQSRQNSSSGPARTLSGPPFVAQLNQAKVELLILADQPWTNTVGWQPDGQPSTVPFPIDDGSMSSWAQGKITKKVAFRIWNDSPEEISYPIVRTDDASGVSAVGCSLRPAWKRQPVTEFIQLICCPTNARTVNLSLGLANGAWETAITLKHENGFGGAESFASPTDGEWSATYNAIVGRGDVAINCNYTKTTNWASRMVALADDGKLTVIPENSSSASALQTGGILLVSSNEFAHIQEFRLQRRKYQWAEFRNVALQSGWRTTVEVAENLVKPVATIEPRVDPKVVTPLFDTVRECVVTNAFRFDTGEQSKVTWTDGKGIEFSSALNALDEKEKFLSQHNIDLFTDDGRGLYGIDIKVRKVEWNPQISYAQLAGPLETSNRYTLYGLNGVCFTSPGTRPAYWFETRTGLKGILQITGFTENPRGVKLRYKLVQNGGAAKNDSPISPALLTELPKLQFLAWQDEWHTNQPGAARHPDGSPVTDATELKWLKTVSSGGMDVSSWHLTPEPRFLKVWFSHPAFDANSLNDLTMFDESGQVVPFGAAGNASCSEQDANEYDGQLGWQVKTFSPDTGTNRPVRLTFRLRYTLGPLEHTQEVPVLAQHSLSLTLEGNGQLSGVGQNIDGKAFVAIAYAPAKMPSRRFGVMAVTKDGRKLMAGGSWGDTGVRAEEFTFELPLADVAKFIIGTRPIRTNEWPNVVLPGNKN